MTNIDVKDLSAATLDRVATPEATAAVMEQVLVDIKANAVEIARGWELGGIMVMVRGEESDDAALFAANLGRAKGGPAVFRMSAAGRRNLGDGLRRVGDAVAAAWCERKGGPSRLLVIEGATAGNLLVNYEASRGIWTEPASLDTDRRT